MNVDNRIKEYQKNISKNILLSEIAKHNSDKFQYTDLSDVTIQYVTDYVLAPALNGFVIWVLKQAMEQGIKRLYFLARDGYFMYHTAIRYIEVYNLPIECRYLYCSRYSVRIPNYHLDKEKALDYITLGGLDVTVKTLYKRAGFDRKQRKQMYDKQILPMEKSVQIPRESLAEIKKRLENNESFMGLLMQNSYKEFPLYKQYLIQEGLLDPVPMALVDSGWVGSMQKELNLSLKQFGKNEPLIGFYWGLYEIPKGTKRHDYHTYFFSPEGEMKRKVVFNNCLFESIFTAPHGMTLRYEQRENVVCPVFLNLNEQRKEKLLFMKEIIASWQQELFSIVGNNSFKNISEKLTESKTLGIIEKNIELFMHHPTKEEAAVFGELAFTDDILENGENRIATKLEEKELMQNHLAGRVLAKFFGKKQYIRQSAWYEGSAVMYGKHPNYHIFHYSCYKYLMNYRKRKIWRQKYGAN